VNRVVEAFRRMRWIDRLFIPLALLLGVTRVHDGLVNGVAWSLAAGAGFFLYAAGKLGQYMSGDDARPSGKALVMQVAGVGLWLASMIWRLTNN